TDQATGERGRYRRWKADRAGYHTAVTAGEQATYPVPPHTGDSSAGPGFVVRVAFDLPGLSASERAAALDAVAYELFELGITATGRVQATVDPDAAAGRWQLVADPVVTGPPRCGWRSWSRRSRTCCGGCPVRSTWPPGRSTPNWAGPWSARPATPRSTPGSPGCRRSRWAATAIRRSPTTRNSPCWPGCSTCCR